MSASSAASGGRPCHSLSGALVKVCAPAAGEVAKRERGDGGWDFRCLGMQDKGEEEVGRANCCSQVSEVLTGCKRFPWQQQDAWI